MLSILVIHAHILYTRFLTKKTMVIILLSYLYAKQYYIIYDLYIMNNNTL